MAILPKYAKSKEVEKEAVNTSTDLSMAYNIQNRNRKKSNEPKLPSSAPYKPEEQSKSILEAIRKKFVTPVEPDEFMLENEDLVGDLSDDDLDLEQEAENTEDLRSIVSKIRAKLRAKK